ncbi:uncharacterized protein LOC126375689 [Pectinophora gossypiella]|uniref:uncharacterized protein LOC126375689 n=1 Tax=Pectinophora gossypiella TaxID=13191 RepID=UPI00214E205D|nr:uncharacterized protein LOC126375689 [Pectinophora gossypiella]
MVEPTFEGSIGDINQRQLEFIKSVIEENGFGGAKVNVEVVGKADDNYMATVKRITAEKDGNTFKMVAKIASSVEQLRMAMNTAMAFRNESVMYTEVFPKFTDLEITAGVPKSERLRYAACYGCLLEEPNEVILLEDLKESNYVILDKSKSLENEAIKLILKNFARLHSLSFALMHIDPQTYTEFKGKVIDIWQAGPNIEQMTTFLVELETELLGILDDEKYRRPFRGLISNMFALSKKYQEHEKYSVIIQGDPWTNNIMFQLQDDKPVECCMIDYQISRFGNPANDLHYMIFNCTDYETRKKHYLDWIDYYHTELDHCLDNFGLKVNFIYPKDKFDADLKRYSKLGLVLSAMLGNVLVRKSEDAVKMKENMQKNLGGDIEQFIESGKVTNLDDNTIYKYKKRMEGVIDSFAELGFISV